MSVARQHEADALTYKLAHPSATYQDIAEAIGMGSAGAAYEAIHRPLRKAIAANVEDMRDVEAARLDKLIEGLWATATNDIELQFQYIGKGPTKIKAMCDPNDGETHWHGQDEAGQVCYVIPTDDMIRATDQVQKLIAKKVEIFGLRHADKIAERKQALDEQQQWAFIEGLKAVLEALNLTKEQQAIAPKVIATQLKVIGGKADAIDTTSTQQTKANDE
jgi:hypothetical protein